MVYIYTKNSDGLFVCQHCGETRKNQNTMHYHLKKHEGNLPFACTLCDKQFLHASTLELHRKAQHDKEEERMFKCPVSGCTFKGTLTRSNLIVHYVRKHKKEEATKAMIKTEKGLYKCGICDKETNSLSAFHYHVAGCLPEFSLPLS